MSDLISRQAAIDALGEKPLAWTEGEYELGLQNQWEHDVDAIRALPPVQPKPKPECSCEQIKWERDLAISQLNELGYGLGEKPRTAHWILLDECSNGGYYCSECHKKVVKEGWSNTVKKIKFCPNCGRKIVEEKKQWAKEAEEAGMTLTEYLDSISSDSEVKK